MYLARAIKLLSQEREWIKEEIPNPKPPRAWFAQTMTELRKEFPKDKIWEIHKKVLNRWRKLPEQTKTKIKSKE